MRRVWLTVGLLAVTASVGKSRMTQTEMIDALLACTQPLEHPLGDRLPFYNWHLGGVGTADDAAAAEILKQLAARGLAVTPAWNPRRQEQTLADGLRVAKLQQQLGLRVNINANSCFYSFCNGDESTAHLDSDGKPFFDYSFQEKKPIGCPFALHEREAAIRGQLEPFLEAYQQAGLKIDFLFVDWEIDGPLAWNDAWAHCQRCTRCRQNIPGIDDFAVFQAKMTELRAGLERRCLSEPVLSRFPDCLVGNYAVYPNDGWRYWYDYFEPPPAEGLPVKYDQRAPYRPWPDEFTPAGFTFGMPVEYTWYRTFDWYDYSNPDYRWFYNLLLVGSNAGRSTPPSIPLITFIHHHTTSPPPEPDPKVVQMSGEAYQELLWHLLLRGHDTFYIWSPQDEAVDETKLAHPVWAAALQYREFLDHGTPLSFFVPRRQGPVVSGLRLGDRVLVRRTDFDDSTEPVELTEDGHRLAVPRAEGRCQVLAVGG